MEIRPLPAEEGDVSQGRARVRTELRTDNDQHKLTLEFIALHDSLARRYGA